jgi:single-stranded-DNA-specific exonuclease
MCLTDMAAAADRVVQAISQDQKVVIWSDYDVDGVTSATILHRALRGFGLSSSVHIPDRETEGYGMNLAGIRRVAGSGTDLLIVADSGSVAFEECAEAKHRGLDVIVVDHHTVEDHLPECVAVINPNRRDHPPGFGHLCAAALTFLLMIAVQSRLVSIGERTAGHDTWGSASGCDVDLMEFVPLVAMATICDVVPLRGVNRAFVRRGLEMMGRTKMPGLRALLEVSGIRGSVTPYAVGFQLGPRINAVGRVSNASAAVEMLCTQNQDFARILAEDLDRANEERKRLERDCLADALQQSQDDESSVICVAGQGWHEGVVGIVASRLKEARDRPAFVCSIDGAQTKGSGRSVEGFDLGAAVIEARRLGVLLKGGGHPMAAGATLNTDRLADFRAFLCEKASARASEGMETALNVDLWCDIDQVGAGLVDAIMGMEPFGQANPRPLIGLKSCRVTSVTWMRERRTRSMNHLKLRLEGASASTSPVDALLFHAASSRLGERLGQSAGEVLDIVGTVGFNEYRGARQVQWIVVDAREASPGLVSYAVA